MIWVALTVGLAATGGVGVFSARCGIEAAMASAPRPSNLILAAVCMAVAATAFFMAGTLF